MKITVILQMGRHFARCHSRIEEISCPCGNSFFDKYGLERFVKWFLIQRWTTPYLAKLGIRDTRGNFWETGVIFENMSGEIFSIVYSGAWR